MSTFLSYCIIRDQYWIEGGMVRRMTVVFFYTVYGSRTSRNAMRIAMR